MLCLGTSSWTNLGNKGEFYPKRITGPREKLQYYSKYFSNVEIESSRYCFPEQKNIRSWIYRTPSHFTFHVRAHAALTAHAVSHKKLPEKISSILNLGPEEKKKDYIFINDRRVIEAIAVEFLKSIELLRRMKKLGHIVFQFPTWFYLNQTNIDHIRMCREIMNDLPLAVEFGHGSWLQDSYRNKVFDFLERNGITYVIPDETQYGNLSTVPFFPHITTETAYVRLHGRSQNWLKKEIDPVLRYDYLYSEEEIGELVLPILKLHEEARTTFVIFNNKAGAAVQNALMMSSMLDKVFTHQKDMESTY
ncbi:MAG: DUF72 domain-containing protein [Nitrospira sp.]|nr:DUF72 domain-containing protein [Nitrospira sp.]